MKTFSILVLALLLLTLPAVAQGPPDCSWTDTFTAATAGPDHANTSSGNSPCVAYRVTYDAVGMSALSVQLEGAPLNSAGTGPGTYAALSGTAIVQGNNPMTDPGNATVATTGTVYYAYVRINCTVFTPTGASGKITVRVYGYKGTSAAQAPGGGGSGFVNPMTSLGDMISGGAAGTPERVAANSSTTTDCLVETGTGTSGAPPAFSPCPTAASLTYYFTDTASSPTASYLQMTLTHPTSLTSLSYAGVTSNEVLQNFATNAANPDLATIPSGSYDCHVRAYKEGGSTTTLYCEIWEVSSAEVDIAKIGTTEQSPPLVSSQETGYDLHYIANTAYTMASTSSRIVARVWENSVGSPTIILTVGGESDAHLALPATTIDFSNFVPLNTPETAGASGVTVNLLASKDTSNPTLYNTAPLGICGAGVAQSTATSGQSFGLLAVPGTLVNIVGQGTITAGHFLTASSTVQGEVADTGQTSPSAIPIATCIVGVAQASATDGQLVSVKYVGAGIFGAGPFVGDSGSGGTLGAVPAPAAGDAAAGKFLAAGGGWSVPSGASGVTAVTGTAPIASSGGTTPAISISNFTGDSGSGGAKGAVPAPSAGDSAAGKFLAAGGGWAVPAGGGGGAPTVQNVVTGSRTAGVVYHNTLSVPLYVSVTAYTGSTSYIQLLTDSSSSPSTMTCTQFAAAALNDVNCFTLVLAGNYYELTGGASVTVTGWTEWH